MFFNVLMCLNINMNITLCVGDQFFYYNYICDKKNIYSMGYQLYITKTSKEQAQVTK